MFHSARLKLTAWYLFIIMLVSVLFSVAIYNLADSEIQRVIRRVEFRREYGNPDFPFPAPLAMGPNIADLQETERRLQIILVLINTGIFVLAGGAGYFLAGRTLQPIQEMVDEQNRFITDSSHELRTPLTSLRSEMEASLLEKHFTDKEARKLITSNLEEVMNLQTLSDRLIALTQHNRKADTNFKKPVSLKEILSQAEKKVASLAKQKHMSIKSLVKDCQIPADEKALIELFVILFDNAIKYSPPKTTISIAAEKTDHIARITITDQGIGIAREDIDHIFDRFYRADKSRTKSDVPGYGLGLSIAKKIIADHNGTISVKSDAGKGTAFVIQLPTA